MMQSDNWLETFQTEARFFLPSLESPPPSERVVHLALLRQKQRALLGGVEALEEILDGKAQQRSMAYLPGLCGFSHGGGVPLDGKQLRYVEDVAARLWTAPGTGRADVEEALLGHIALSADPASLPFYRAAIAASRPRDVFAPKRRRLALAAIAFLAAAKGCQEADAELRRHLGHEDPAVRGEAVDCFAQIHLTEDGELRTEAALTLAGIAQGDQAFLPRFIARRWLAQTGHEVPIDSPNGVYGLRATLGRASCTVELAAVQGLAQLAGTILSGFGWDWDHLYEFAMTNDIRDRRFVLPPAGEDPRPPESGRATGKPGSSVMDAPIGALGLVRGHRFVFRYDFGDEHRFTVVVAAIHPRKEPGIRYPRVVASTGRTVEQYPSWE